MGFPTYKAQGKPSLSPIQTVDSELSDLRLIICACAAHALSSSSAPISTQTPGNLFTLSDSIHVVLLSVDPTLPLTFPAFKPTTPLHLLFSLSDPTSISVKVLLPLIQTPPYVLRHRPPSYFTNSYPAHRCSLPFRDQ